MIWNRERSRFTRSLVFPSGEFLEAFLMRCQHDKVRDKQRIHWSSDRRPHGWNH